MKIVFLVCACISIAAVVLICIFMFANGMPAIQEIGPIKFLFGTEWKPGQGIFGIGPMIIGSIYVTAGAMIIGVPIGLLTAVFLAKYCPSTLYKVIKPIINLMAGIPSIIYGFFGLVAIVPAIQDMIAGNQPIFPDSILSGTRTLTTNIVLEMAYSTGLHRKALIATAVVLFVFILIINVCFSILNRRSES